MRFAMNLEFVFTIKLECWNLVETWIINLVFDFELIDKIIKIVILVILSVTIIGQNTIIRTKFIQIVSIFLVMMIIMLVICFTLWIIIMLILTITMIFIAQLINFKAINCLEELVFNFLWIKLIRWFFIRLGLLRLLIWIKSVLILLTLVIILDRRHLHILTKRNAFLITPFDSTFQIAWW